MSELSQIDFFTIIGVVIFLIAIGLILPAFIVKDHHKRLGRRFWVVPETVTKNDSIISNERE